MSDTLDLFDIIIDMNHVDKLIREAAFTQLIDLGPDVVPELVDMFPDIAGQARLYTIRAFGEIGHDAASSLLADLVTTQDPDEYFFVSSLAAKSLGQIGAVDHLVELLESDRTGPRRMAATVLRNICDERSVEGLAKGLHDDDDKVRDICWDALKCIGTPHALALLDAHQTHPR